MGVRDVKVVLQPPFSTGFVNDRNAGSSRVDPPAKLPVPFFQLQHRRGVGPLGIDQDLLVEWTFIIVAGRPQKARPALIITGQSYQRAAV